MAPLLSRDEARAFYDRFGSKQDRQAFYEDAAVADLVAHADFARATSVYEIGCGTGRFAAELLSRVLPPDCRYRATDISGTMVELARARLAPWQDRATVLQVPGAPRLEAEAGSCDRVVANYVFDLLPEPEIRAFVADAARVLPRDGRLCLVSLTHGVGPLSRLVASLWGAVARRRPRLVGGCRPIRLLDHVGDGWAVVHRAAVVRWGVPSEVLVAQPLR